MQRPTSIFSLESSATPVYAELEVEEVAMAAAVAEPNNVLVPGLIVSIGLVGSVDPSLSFLAGRGNAVPVLPHISPHINFLCKIFFFFTFLTILSNENLMFSLHCWCDTRGGSLHFALSLPIIFSSSPSPSLYISKSKGRRK